MKRISKIMFFSFSTALLLFAAPTATYADNKCPSLNGSDSGAQRQVFEGIRQTGGNCDDSEVGTIANSVVNILSYVAGVLAIIFIIVAGFRFITSGGDSNKVAAARSALVAAVIGIVIAALAQLIVHFVLRQSEIVTDPCTKNVPNSQDLTSDDAACR